ncbi:MAG: nitroreductase family protein [Treponema sp.]|nr:nitroreductase family protein [Treponema sp.]
MNEIIKSLFSRKSVRQYETRPVTPDEKNLILQSALQAPTAGNQNLYTILDITDEDLKTTLSKYCDNQPFIAKAPLALIFLADCRRWFDSYQFAGLTPRPPEEGDLMISIADAVIAAQNTVVAAEALGIGSCYIGDILEQEENVRKVLSLDEYVFPAAFVVYGYPSKAQMEREKPARPPLSCIVQENCYRRMNENEHFDMFIKKGSIKDKNEFREYIRAFYDRKYNSDFANEMNRSAKRYLEQFNIL